MNSVANLATHMLPDDLQLTNEYRFSRKHINERIRQAIEAKPEYQTMVDDGIARVEAWLTQPFYNSKRARLDQLEQMNIPALVADIIVGSAYFQKPETFVSVSSMLAKHLDFSDHRDAIITIAELCAVLCWTGAFTIFRESEDLSMMFISALQFPPELTESIERSRYLLPMVCEPQPVTSNFESPYLTHNDCRILGKKNGHDGDICLDIINTQMAVPLKLATDFISSVEEVPTYELDTAEKLQEWSRFKRESYELYHLIVKQGNRFWLDQKVDKRGRLYAQGYHIHTQGSAFKKACIELSDEELVSGVPNKLQKN
jgi:hypothetical protein